MKELFQVLAQVATANGFHFAWDFGQLQNAADFNAIKFPACLCSVNINWQGTGGGQQVGAADVQLTFCFEDYGTREQEGPGTIAHLSFLDELQAITVAISRAAGQTFSTLQRTSQQQIQASGPVLAVQANFKTSIFDSSLSIFDRYQKITPDLQPQKA